MASGLLISYESKKKATFFHDFHATCRQKKCTLLIMPLPVALL